MSTTATAERKSRGKSAADTTKTKTRSKTKVKAKDGRATSRRSKKRGTSDKQRAANKLNSEKSTGPRTPEGKRNSKYNALSHGMTARSVLLPGENPAELAAHQQHLIDSFQPRHAVELAIVERMAADIWRADRAERGAGLRIAERLRHEPLEKTRKEQEEAVELGGRLLWQPSFPLPVSRRFPSGKITEPQCAECPSHPHHPARLRLRLEQTLHGCDWLIERWNELLQRLYFHEVWLTADNFYMVRLMGKHAIDMANNLDVVRVFLCGLTLLSAPKAGPEREAFDWKDALIRMLVTFDVENKHGVAASAAKQCEPFARRLAELPLAKLAPKDENQARSWLTALIEQELRRIRDIRLYLQVVADADEAEAPARLAFETGPEGDRQRRYGLSSERVVIKRFGDFLKTRSMIVAGTFDPTDVELQALLGTAAPSVVSSPLPVVSEQPMVVQEPGAAGDVRQGDGDRESFVTSSEFSNVYEDAQILRNEPNSPVFSGPLCAVDGESDTAKENEFGTTVTEPTERIGPPPHAVAANDRAKEQPEPQTEGSPDRESRCSISADGSDSTNPKRNRWLRRLSSGLDEPRTLALGADIPPTSIDHSASLGTSVPPTSMVALPLLARSSGIPPAAIDPPISGALGVPPNSIVPSPSVGLRVGCSPAATSPARIPRTKLRGTIPVSDAVTV